MRHALRWLPLVFAGCDLVLGVPNPDEVKNIESVGERLCECPSLLQQGAEVIEACEAAVDGLSEDGLKAIAEADCTDCGKSSECYGLATGAGDAGSSCSSHSECRSFACCLTNLSESLLDGAGVVTGVCCEACAGCSGLFASGVEWLLPMCVDVVEDFFTPTAEPNPENDFLALSVCLCQEVAMAQCFNEGLCPDPALPENDCLTLLSSSVCRDCLFATVTPPDACKPQLDACNAGPDRPRQ